MRAGSESAAEGFQTELKASPRKRAIQPQTTRRDGVQAQYAPTLTRKSRRTLAPQRLTCADSGGLAKSGYFGGYTANASISMSRSGFTSAATAIVERPVFVGFVELLKNMP